MNKSRTTINLAGAALLGGCLGASLLAAGCVGYNTYPKQEGIGGFTNPNSDPFPPLMTEAVRWTITRYPSVQSAEWSPPMGVPPEGSQFAINLPVGVNRLLYQRVCDRIGYGAVPMTPGREELPTYHISRIWVNGDEAKVEVVRNVLGMPKLPDGRPTTQAITVRLRGGLSPWHVTSHKVWAFNAVPVPALNYMPEEGAPTPQPVIRKDEAGGEELINLPEQPAATPAPAVPDGE